MILNQSSGSFCTQTPSSPPHPSLLAEHFWSLLFIPINPSSPPFVIANISVSHRALSGISKLREGVGQWPWPSREWPVLSHFSPHEAPSHSQRLKGHTFGSFCSWKTDICRVRCFPQSHSCLVLEVTQTNHFFLVFNF